MAATEIKGSRETTATNKVTTAVKLLVSTAATDVAAVGTYYLSESAPTGRTCVHNKVTPEFLPAVFLLTEQYQGVVAY